MKILAALLAAAPLVAQFSVQWEHNLAAAQKRAAAEKKRLFVDVWAEWCPPCQRLKKDIFPTPEAQKGLAAYVPVSLMTETRDRKPDQENMRVAEQFNVTAYPTLLILDSNGKELKRHVGAFASGADLAAWLAQ